MSWCLPLRRSLRIVRRRGRLVFAAAVVLAETPFLVHPHHTDNTYDSRAESTCDCTHYRHTEAATIDPMDELRRRKCSTHPRSSSQRAKSRRQYA